MPTTNTKFCEKRNNYVLPKLLNNLPENLKNLSSFNIVKTSIKKWMLSTVTVDTWYDNIEIIHDIKRITLYLCII